MKSLIKANEKKIPTLCTQGQTIPSFYRNTLKKCVCLSPLWNFIPTFSQTNKNLVLVALFWRFNIFFKNCKVWDLEQKPFVLQFIYINSVSLTEMNAPNTSCKQKTQKKALHFLFFIHPCIYICVCTRWFYWMCLSGRKTPSAHHWHWPVQGQTPRIWCIH